MSSFAPFTEAQFQYLAMGKARAYTWDTLAEQINMPLEIVERVAWTHEKLWNRFLAKAERHIARETLTEVAVVLRKDIRNAEPHLHATLANSLSRVLKQQQDFAPQRRPCPVTQNPITPAPAAIPTPAPLPPAPTPTPAATPTVGPTLGATMASLLAFFVLLGALLMGCWTKTQRPHERAEYVACAPFAMAGEPVHASGTVALESRSSARVVLTPPPWVREHDH